MLWASLATGIPGALAFVADQLDHVTVGVGDEGDDCRAGIHRAGIADDATTLGLDRSARGVDVIYFDCDVAIGVTQLVLADSPVVSQLDHCVFGLAAVADEGEREFSLGIVLPAQ